MRQELVLREDRTEAREVGVTRVRREDQDQRRRDLDVIEDRRATEDHARDLRGGRDLVRVLDAQLVREDRESDEEHGEDSRHPHERRRRVLRLRLLERRNAVGDRFHPRERRAPRRERPQDDEPREAVRSGDHPLVRELRGAQARVDRNTDEPDNDQDEEPDDERIRRDREDGAGLADASQIEQCDDRHEHHRQLNPK